MIGFQGSFVFLELLVPKVLHHFNQDPINLLNGSSLIRSLMSFSSASIDDSLPVLLLELVCVTHVTHRRVRLRCR